MSFERQSRVALRIALTYAVVSALWILFSDLVLAEIANPRLVAELSIAKGWVFVLVTAALLFWLIRRDVARVVKAETQERFLFDSVNDAIYVFLVNHDGTSGRFIDANEPALRRLGYTRDELMRMSAWDIIKPEMMPRVWEAVETRKRTGSAVFESVHVTKDGREIPVEVSSRIIRMNDVAIGINIARDVTERLRTEEERRQEEQVAERDKRRFYRETILAVTGGKFELGDPEDAEGWVRGAELEIDLGGIDRLSEARRQVASYALAQGLYPSAASDLEIAVGEALGNALKHAGGGSVKAGKTDDSVWVAVRDHGTGIDTFALPKVALMPGFTTMASMGLGYTLILEVSDHVKIATGPSGTTVVLEKRLNSVTEIDSRIARHAGIE
jgi:PAS domain S-box-containing protein